MRAIPRQGSHGNAKFAVVAALVAISLGANFAWNMYESGARDPSYIFFMSLAAVVALALVAPRRFNGRGDANEEWEDEDEESPTKLETPMPADSVPAINAEKDGAHGR